MILQKIVTPGNRKGCDEIYIRSSNLICKQSNLLFIPKGGNVSTDTYMNAFDIGAWKKYTDISGLLLVWKFKGQGTMKVIWEREKEGAVCLGEKLIDSRENGFDGLKYDFDNWNEMSEGLLYFIFSALEDTSLEAWFEEWGGGKMTREIKISLVICTYKRRKQLQQILNMLQKENEREKWNAWLQVIVIDNASELETGYGDGIFIYHNRNTGGSGGFGRGIDETIKRLDVFPTTHVVFMDDDVVLQMESLRRLYAFLSFMKEEYVQEVIVGRMFGMDRPCMQYTAAEVWNKGDIRHIGGNQDMTKRQFIWHMNENEGGEYGGWWFACFPVEFVKENRPLPFFLHCDDVEYGLRHGGTPVILNGIQVWHEIYEYWKAPVLAYYDSRNRALVNHLYGLCDKEEILNHWIKNISFYHVRREYTMEYYAIIGFLDFLKGMEWAGRIDAGKYHEKLRRKKGNRVKNALMWRLAKALFRINYSRTFWGSGSKNG